MVAGRLVFNSVKLTDRDWDRTRDLASISTVSEPMELKLMTTSLSHLKATQHLNWGTYYLVWALLSKAVLIVSS